ncbi:MAG TPA: caleosin family protein [Usitatibacteraceae bacterium]|nr:caleosin family protein [Usitatibacteraceae bacterium]
MSVSQAVPKSFKPSVSRSKPQGRGAGALPRTLKARSRTGDTTLQRHASFFDDNGDRAVDVAECTRGLKALGLPFGVAEAAALAIVAPLSIQTRGSLLALSIDIENIQKGKHDSDTGILDNRGRFNARRFDKVFGACSTVDRNGDKAFTATELTRMIAANRKTLLGSLVSTIEWQVLLALAADTKAVERGKTVPALSVARMKSFYDGTLFYNLARAHA